jgi:hypothetical protein
MPKIKATSDPKQLCKLLKGISDHGPPEALWAIVAPDKTVECIQEHLLDVLAYDKSVNGSLMKSSAMKAWDMPAAQAQMYADKFMLSLSHCRVKLKQRSSGKKLHPSVNRVCDVLESSSPTPAKTTGSSKKKCSSPEKSPKPSGARSVHEVQESPPPRLRRKRALEQKEEEEENEEKRRGRIFGLFGLEVPTNYATDCAQQVDSDSDVEASSTLAESLPIETGQSQGNSSGSADNPKKNLPEFWDANNKEYIRVLPGHGKVVAQLTAGPKGFCLAKFPDEPEHETEIPNLVLQLKVPQVSTKSILKRPAAAAAAAAAAKASAKADALKTKAAACKAANKRLYTKTSVGVDFEPEVPEPQVSPAPVPLPAVAAVEVPAAPAQVAVGMGYHIMYYAKTEALALRQTQPPKKQLFQILFPSVPLEAKRKILQTAILKLLEGQLTESTVKAFVLQEILKI